MTDESDLFSALRPVIAEFGRLNVRTAIGVDWRSVPRATPTNGDPNDGAQFS